MSSTNLPSEESTKDEKDGQQQKPIFRELDPDDEEPEATVIESACMNCFQTGVTRLLLTKIPLFKEIVLMHFKCDHCGFENNEIQTASEIQKKGVHIKLHVETVADLNRRVVRSDYTGVKIPEVELEIPAQSQKGEVTTVEGIVDRTIRGLMQDQEKRRTEHPEEAAAIDAYVDRLQSLKELKEVFTLELEDISGNSFVENCHVPAADPNCKTTFFTRSKEQDQILGLYASPLEVLDEDKEVGSSSHKAEENHLLKPIEEDAWPLEELHGEVLRFNTICSECRAPCETNMKLTNIPHFKEVVIMATVCEVCGSKTNEVKSGGGIEEKAVRLEVRIETKEDLTRDVLKSETCSLSIPELECEVGPNALGGRFTTVEGILTAMRDQIDREGVMFQDSADKKAQEKLDEFLAKFDGLLSLGTQATLILDDPAGNSYVQSLRDDDEPDEKLKVVKYERSFEQNEELGLNDIKTENYEES